MASVVRFNTRRTTNKGLQIQLVYRIVGDANKLVLSTGIHVAAKHWNVKAMNIRSNAPNAIHDNAQLDYLKNCGNETLNHFRQKKITPTKSQFREFYLSLVNGQPVLGESSYVLEYFDSFISEKHGSITASSLKQYQNSKNHLKDFISKKKNGIKIEFDDLDILFFKGYIKYLKGLPLEDNTIHKIIKKLRSILNHAHRKGLNNRLDYKDKACQVSYVKQPKIYLNQQELALIKKHKLVAKSRLDKVRDILVLGCNTGLRYSDLSRLIPEMIVKGDGHDVIKILVQKKGAFVSIPINKHVAKIIKKYDGFPPMISLQKFNEYLEELCKAAKINTTVFREEGKKQVAYKKYELVSSHICRRSFATNFFKETKNAHLLRKITGHSTIKQFMEYICIDQQEAVAILADHPAFA